MFPSPVTAPPVSPVVRIPVATPALVFADATAWAALPGRIAADPVLARIAAAARERAERHLAAPPIAHSVEGLRRLTPARLFQGRVIDLATIARLDGDARAAARAREEILAVVALPDWGEVHFLDVAEYALGVAIGFSWLPEVFSPAERERVASALVERALRPSFEGAPETLRWLGGRSNWTQVCHAGLATAALAVADREPALAVRTLTRAVEEQAGPASAYAPDGAYPEGPMYWIYGTTFQVVLISLIESAGWQDHGLADFPGFLASADYMAQMIAPSGRFFNYGDSRDLVPPMPVLHWFAARRGEPGIAAAELHRLESGRCGPTGELRAIYERLDALALWWRATPLSVSGNEAPRTLPLLWFGRGETPVAVARTAWGDARAAFFAIKGGRASSSHAHLDAGGFVFEAGGVRWAVDPGMQEYHSLEAAGVRMWDGAPGGERWSVFRLGPEAHNILRFDEVPPHVEGEASLREAAEGGEVLVELTALHRPRLVEVERRARLASDGVLRIEDRWRGGEEVVVARWQWLTEADVETTSEGARLHQGGRTLALRVLAPVRGQWSLEIEEVSGLLRPSDAPCPGLKRLTIRVPSAAGADGRLEVEARLS